MSSSKITTKTIYGDWEEVYSVQDVTETLWTENSAFIRETKYYKTSNRKEEAGYFVMSESMVWKVRRPLYQSWITEPIKNTTLEYEPADEMAGKVARCRLVEVIELRATRQIIDNHILWGNAIEIVKNLRDGLGPGGDAAYKDLCLGGILHSFAYIDKYLDLLPQDSCPTYKEVLQDLVKRQEEGSDSEESSDESSGSESDEWRTQLQPTLLPSQ